MPDYNFNSSAQLPNSGNTGLQYNFGADVSSLAATLDVTPQELNTALNVLQGIMNLAGTGAGSGLLPLQQGGFTVPAPTNVKATNLGAVAGATKLAVTWNDADDPPGATVDHYNVYVQNIVANAGAQQPALQAATAKSPAIFTVVPSGANAMQTIVQTVLTNGYLLPLAQAPSATVIASNPNVPPSALNGSLFITNLTFTNNSPSAGDIAWTACQVFYQGNEYNISSGSTSSPLVAWTVGNSSFTGLANNQWLAAINIFLIGTNNLGVADSAWNKIASAGVTHDMVQAPTELYGRNGSLAFADITFTDNSPTINHVSWSSGHVTYKGITYTISTGVADPNFWVYWQLSSPNQFNTSSGPNIPSLGIDDFFIGINDNGSFEPIFGLDANNGIHSNHGAGSFAVYNTNDAFGAVLALANANVTTSGGLLVIGNGAGVQSWAMSDNSLTQDNGSFVGQTHTATTSFTTLGFKNGILVSFS